MWKDHSHFTDEVTEVLREFVSQGSEVNFPAILLPYPEHISLSSRAFSTSPLQIPTTCLPQVGHLEDRTPPDCLKDTVDGEQY